jgi:hypothetical protein
MELLQKEGREFVAAEPEEVIDFLRCRSSEALRLPPENMHVVNDGKLFYLHCSYDGLREYPVRKAFVAKLLRWFSVPRRVLDRLDIDTATMVLNDLLLNITSGDVTVTIENGDALTVTSARYSEITDLGIIERCRPLGIERISRNDYFMRLYSSMRCEEEPEPGDICSFSYNVVNSETGFRALSVGHYILRYICSNGAVVPIKGMHKRIHYGFRQGELFGLLDRHLAAGEAVRQKVVEALKASVSKQLNGERERVVKGVDALLGSGRGRALVQRLPGTASRYDLFNELTSMAKRYPIGIRLQLEVIAGGLLN